MKRLIELQADVESKRHSLSVSTRRDLETSRTTSYLQRDEANKSVAKKDTGKVMESAKGKQRSSSIDRKLKDGPIRVNVQGGSAVARGPVTIKLCQSVRSVLMESGHSENSQANQTSNKDKKK